MIVVTCSENRASYVIGSGHCDPRERNVAFIRSQAEPFSKYATREMLYSAE